MTKRHAYLCYCLRSCIKENRSYVGITNNFPQRLRRHNGEIVGGARYTRSYRPWAPLFKVRGFRDKTDVLRFEWALKHRRRSRKGANAIDLRCITLEYLLNANPKESTADMVKKLKLGVHIKLSKLEYLQRIGVTEAEFNQRHHTVTYVFSK